MLKLIIVVDAENEILRTEEGAYLNAYVSVEEKVPFLFIYSYDNEENNPQKGKKIAGFSKWDYWYIDE